MGPRLRDFVGAALLTAILIGLVAVLVLGNIPRA
jgi:hypothetical protein